MKYTSRRRTLLVTVVILAGLIAPLSVATAQTTYTNTLTQTTSVYSTNTILTTITSPVLVSTTTTETMNSTIQGTQTVFQSSVTTSTSTYTIAVGGTVTQTTTMTLTQVSTETMQLLGNFWGASLALVLFAVALASFIVPALHPIRPKGVVCSNCGTRNPPFAKAFCVKCGHSLK
jgi:hypothetical protein